MCQAPYEVSPRHYDEAFRPDGSPRPGYESLIETLARDPRAAQEAVQRHLGAGGVEFGPPDSRSTFAVDPVPRLFAATEWSGLEAGLIQRVTALREFVSDAYGERSVVEAGVLPARILEESRYYEPIMTTTGMQPISCVSGPDIIRNAGGELMVLEDNLRSPSGLLYAAAGRAALGGIGDFAERPVRPLDGLLDGLHDTLRRADPTGSGDPAIAILSDGPASNAWYEHRETKLRLGVPLVAIDDLSCRSGRLEARAEGKVVAIDVLYNRSSQESLRDDSGALSPFGELLAEPLKRGNLACVNPFGTGIADDKATFCYVDEMIRHYLGEEPLLDSIPAYDLGDPDRFDEAIGRIDELVIKPRWSFGGHGVVLGSEASPDELRRTEAAVRSTPGRFIAQETVDISVHPTVAGDELEPRHVDFRPFVLSRDFETTVIPGGLTRFAGSAGDRIVNSTQGGGAKDTWVLS